MKNLLPFRYLTDPLCIACLLLYPLNRWYLKPHRIGGHFTVAFLNDTICLPLFLPMILYLQRRLGVRRHDGPPRLWEVFQHAAIFSIVFKAIMPRYPQIFRTSGDPWDMLAYIAGGLGAWLIWRCAASPSRNMLSSAYFKSQIPSPSPAFPPDFQY